MKIRNVSITNSQYLKLRRHEVKSLLDLGLIMPKGYYDFTQTRNIADIAHQEVVLLKAKAISRSDYSKVLELLVEDQTSTLRVLFFRVSPFLLKKITNWLASGEKSYLLGKVVLDKKNYVLVNPQLFFKPKEALIPFYGDRHGLKSWEYRKIFSLISWYTTLQDYLPSEILVKHGLMTISQALEEIHKPQATSRDDLVHKVNIAKRRIYLEEVVAHYLSAEKCMMRSENNNHWTVHINKAAYRKFIQSLPFVLTPSQKKVIEEIFVDLSSSNKPMLRLIQGDVGCGKTVVFAAAILQNSLNQLQSVVLVPNSILAIQHYETLKSLFKTFQIQLLLLHSKMSTKETETVYEILAKDNSAVLVSTTSCFNKDIKYQKLSLLVIDEQHKFGVNARNTLAVHMSYNNTTLHTLILSATPIPRTIMMVQYGYLVCSKITDKPNAGHVMTSVMSQHQRGLVIVQLADAVIRRKQAYWICPLKHDSPNSEMKSVEEVKSLLQRYISHANIGAIHGSSSPTEQEKVLESFNLGTIDILVSTSIVEVGIHVLNATIMIIESANRLGLAQLHQLRGRINRSKSTSYCILLYDDDASTASKLRLHILKQENDGMKIAMLDMAQRGGGDLLGEEQSGNKIWKITPWSYVPELAKQAASIGKELQLYPESVSKILKRWLQ